MSGLWWRTPSDVVTGMKSEILGALLELLRGPTGRWDFARAALRSKDDFVRRAVVVLVLAPPVIVTVAGLYLAVARRRAPGHDSRCPACGRLSRIRPVRPRCVTELAGCVTSRPPVGQRAGSRSAAGPAKMLCVPVCLRPWSSIAPDMPKAPN